MVHVFLFHRDLRLDDNTALIQLARTAAASPGPGAHILPIFIFPPEQIEPAKNPYFSHPSVQFMCQSLDDLEAQLKHLGSHLYCFKGDTVAILKQLYRAAANAGVQLNILAWNEDYSVYATQRDTAAKKIWEELGGTVQTAEDYGLLSLREGLLPDGRPYRVLSQFYKKVLQLNPGPRRPDPFRLKAAHFCPRAPFAFPPELQKARVSSTNYHTFYTPLPDLAIQGGRTRALAVLSRVRQGEWKDYAARRDYPAQPGTTRLSPHLKFGTLSIRELAQTLRDTPGYGMSHPLYRELVFRDFYLKIYALQPELQRGTALLSALDKAVPWSYDKTLFHAWTTGTTGFPLVDAGMRELNTTGFQHNRIRMLTSSVLTKYFLIDWRWGLKYFYQHLVDADVFSNTAGWGFSSSTGADAVPYFRAPFNPFIQSKKFDPEATYIHRWVPELRSVAAADLHRWDDPAIRAKYPGLTYPAPIVSQKEASARAIQVFRKAMEKTK
jgi:deoxyribodipyrimidine photo-lyase